MKAKKTLLIIIFIIFTLLLIGNLSRAEDYFYGFGRRLEVEYPEFSGFKIQRTTTSLPEYIRYLYYFAIGISSFIALGVLIYAGFRYLTSAGNPEKLKDAKSQIAAALLGLTILFLSFLIVNTINPELTRLKITPTIATVPECPGGVWVCNKRIDTQKLCADITTAMEARLAKDNARVRELLETSISPLIMEMTESCMSIEDTETNFPNWSSWFLHLVSKPLYSETQMGQVTPGEYLYFIYGALAEERSSGKKRVYTQNLSSVPVQSPQHHVFRIQHPKSIAPFIPFRARWNGADVMAYQKVNYNRDFPNLTPHKCHLAANTVETTCSLPFPAESIKLDEVESILVLVYKSSTPDDYVVFITSENNLLQYLELIEFRWFGFWFFFDWVPAADRIRIISLFGNVGFVQ